MAAKALTAFEEKVLDNDEVAPPVRITAFREAMRALVAVSELSAQGELDDRIGAIEVAARHRTGFRRGRRGGGRVRGLGRVLSRLAQAEREARRQPPQRENEARFTVREVLQFASDQEADEFARLLRDDPNRKTAADGRAVLTGPAAALWATLVERKARGDQPFVRQPPHLSG